MTKERRLKSLSIKVLQKLAIENGVELIKKGWLRSSPITNSADMLQVLLKSNQIKDKTIMTIIENQITCSPVDDAELETVEQFKKLYYRYETNDFGYLSDSEHVVYLITDKNELWLREADNSIFDFINYDNDMKKEEKTIVGTRNHIVSSYFYCCISLSI